MPNETVVREDEVRTAPIVQPGALAQVVDAIRVDSEEAPAEYLAESRVPHGGE